MKKLGDYKKVQAHPLSAFARHHLPPAKPKKAKVATCG